jgi:hypothetical protein
MQEERNKEKINADYVASDFTDSLEPVVATAVSYKTALFEGKSMIVLTRNPDDKWPLQFGYSKAKLILDNIEAIKAFVAHEETVRTANPNQYKKNTLKKGTLK